MPTGPRRTWDHHDISLMSFYVFFPISWNPNQTSALFSNKMESMEIGFMLEFWTPKLQFGSGVILDISGAHVFLVGICWHDVWRITASPKPELRGCWVHSLGRNDVWANLFPHIALGVLSCLPAWNTLKINQNKGQTLLIIESTLEESWLQTSRLDNSEEFPN